ncbi:PspA/IM30 family protein [Aestuariispira ectoiniformans]|uniref:PspA/IM30 family protein n=1 Tax=Aestuariispira ectoiniformans TaxID=2775080 RepID=UPI00223BFFAF|nr:PspA/IM30 family protein [Aestuariispira ectoiniformans]
MSENLANRVGRLVGGTINKIVDIAEDMAPEVVMEEAIREVDRAIDDIRAELGKLLAQSHLATNRLSAESAKHDDLKAKAKLALDQGREDLAEVAVSQMVDIEAQIPVLEQTIADAGDREKELESYIAALKGRRSEMAEELKAFRDARQASIQIVPEGSAASGGTVDVTVDKAEQAFNRVMERNGGVGVAGGELKDTRQLAELEDMARQQKIRDRLNQIKEG